MVVKGEHVLDTYHNSEETFKKQKIVVGSDLWHKTGDSGYVKDGLLFLTGPCDALIEFESKLRSPFVFESKIRQLEGISEGTFIMHDSKLVVVIESSLTEYSNIDELAKIIKLDSLIILKKIPMDVRHQTKINYIELAKIVKNGLNKNSFFV